MNYLNNSKLLGLMLALTLGLVACDKKPGPAEQAGKSIDQSMDKAGKKMDDAVDKVDKKVSEQSAKTGQAIDDAEITTKVKASIFAESGLRTLQISVDTIQGVVTLTGTVDSPANAEKASALAHAVAGVKSVDSKLVVVSSK
jgi:osmotically-inducible protein OsmY